MAKIYDEFCSWPYHEPYGMVTAPKKPKTKKPRTPRTKPDWLASPKKATPKKEKPIGTPRKQRAPRRRKLVVEASASLCQAHVLEAAPQSIQEVFQVNGMPVMKTEDGWRLLHE